MPFIRNCRSRRQITVLFYKQNSNVLKGLTRAFLTSVTAFTWQEDLLAQGTNLS